MTLYDYIQYLIKHDLYIDEDGNPTKEITEDTVHIEDLIAAANTSEDEWQFSKKVGIDNSSYGLVVLYENAPYGHVQRYFNYGPVEILKYYHSHCAEKGYI